MEETLVQAKYIARTNAQAPLRVRFVSSHPEMLRTTGLSFERLATRFSCLQITLSVLVESLNPRNIVPNAKKDDANPLEMHISSLLAAHDGEKFEWMSWGHFDARALYMLHTMSTEVHTIDYADLLARQSSASQVQLASQLNDLDCHRLCLAVIHTRSLLPSDVRGPRRRRYRLPCLMTYCI